MHDASETKHRTAIHRPDCVAGYRYTKDRQMMAEFCPDLVASDITFKNSKTGHNSHPYKDYQSIYPDWSIPTDATSQDCLYWMSFVARYKDKLARYYEDGEGSVIPPEVPSQWLKITKEALKKHLRSVYHV